MLEIEFNNQIYHKLSDLRTEYDSKRFYGPHITIDCDKCDHLAIVDEKNIESFLTGIANHIGMQIIGGPYCGNYKNDIRNPLWGLSGLLLIAESHVAIHTYPHFEKNYALLDIFSCKHFDILDALEYTIKRLNPNYVYLNIVTRGSRFHIMNE